MLTPFRQEMEMPCFLRCWLRQVLTLLIFIAPLSAWAGTPLELTIVHVNDTHSHLEGVSTSLKLEGEKTYLSLGGMARLSTLLQEVRTRSNNTLFLHAGDAVQGTLYFTKFHGKMEMTTLHALGCDAMVLGNHEFDRGPAGAAAIVGWARFPMLAANMDCAAEPVLKGKTLPYVVKEVAGQKVGIVGIITPEVKVISNVGPNLGFAPASQTARRVIAQLQARGVDKIILLTHQGYDEDLALAKEVAGIDVIVGGHSHTLLGDAQSMGRLGLEPQGAYPTRVNGPGGRPVYVVQAWQWGQVAGLLELSFDQEGVVTHAEGRALLVMGDNFRRKGAGGKKAALDGQARQELMAKLAANPSARVLPYDKQIVKMIAPYRKGLKELRETVVARVDRDLLHTRQPGRHPSGVDLPQGSLLAPLIARVHAGQGALHRHAGRFVLAERGRRAQRDHGLRPDRGPDLQLPALCQHIVGGGDERRGTGPGGEPGRGQGRRGIPLLCRRAACLPGFPDWSRDGAGGAGAGTAPGLRFSRTEPIG